MTVAEKLKSWLDEIGADGLMVNMSSSDHVYQINSKLERAIESWGLDMLVPTFRHADGSYHTKPEASHDEHCPCICQAFKDWNKHKEAKK